MSKSKKSEQYFRDKIEIFIRLFDEHFACHFESYWRETWRHTGRRTVPGISLEAPPPSPLCEVFNIVSTSRIFEVEKDKIGEIMDGAVPANARQQIKASVSVSIVS